jgi:hypothetical protein
MRSPISRLLFLTLLPLLSASLAPTTASADTSIPVEGSTITEAAKVLLDCTSGHPHRATIKLRIEETRRVAAADVPAEVPSIFIENMTDEKFYIREFKLNGTAKLKDSGSGDSETFKDRLMYGNFAFTEPTEGFKRLNMYGDYENFMFRAVTIEYYGSDNTNNLELYYSGDGGATNYPLNCKGVMPDFPATRPAEPAVEPYHRSFACTAEKRGAIAKIDFNFQVKNLHKPRLVEAVYGEEDENGVAPWVFNDDPDHQINIFNEGDSYLTVGGTPEKPTLALIGDSDGVVTARLVFAYPKAETKTLESRFIYSADGEGTRWTKVKCSLSPL